MSSMRALCSIAAAAVILAAGCTRPPERREYTVDGQVVAIQPADGRVVIRHQDIKGFMPGMTMPFPVKDRALLAAAQPGDYVSATLVVTDGDAWLSRIAPTGRHEAIPADAAVPRAMEAPLGEGQPVPDADLVDQTGKPFSPATRLRGHPWAVTFVYTRCPLPNFCPTLERKFVDAQRAIRERSSLADVRLVTVSIDPGHDTPAVLTTHAKALGADPGIWTLATGPLENVQQFSQRFGVMVQRGNGTPEELVHSMRTAVVDRQGRIGAVFEGSEWQSTALVEALERAAGAR
jgi:protein SCO1/2